MRRPRPVLVTIPISHFCEKARWALDRSGMEYEERRHLQIFHYLPVWLTARGISAPAFRAGDVRLNDSTDILRWVDAQAGLGLYASEECLELEEWFDEELGPATRRVAYFHLIEDPALVLEYNNAGAPRAEAWLLGKTYGMARRILVRRLRISEEAVAGDVEIVRRVFEVVAGRLKDGRRYLVGDRFSAADLTFAALAAPVVVPAEYGVTLPPRERHPAGLGALVDELRGTVAGRFALRVYREDRRRRS